MSFPREEGTLRAWALAPALFVLALPLYHADLFWHLSSGRWIWAHGAVPRTDPFSFTHGGEPWQDFEWLFQAVVYALHSLGGLALLRLFKCLWLAACWLPVDGLLKDRGVPPLSRALGLAFWAACVLPQADLRPDLVSMLCFAVLLRRLDKGRASFGFGLALFALWSNSHLGFLLGFGLYAARLLSEKAGRKAVAAEAAGAALGALLNPYGWRIYETAWRHAVEGGTLSRYIMEWGGLSPRFPFQWPLCAGLLVFAAAFWQGRARLPRFLSAAALPLAAATLASSRLGAFFAAAGTAALFTLFPRPAKKTAYAGLAVLTLLLAWPFSRVRWNESFSDAYVARRAVEFIVREDAALKGLRLFNTYEWGGYLGWRRPETPVFGDGRYLFAAQLPETEAALGSVEAFADFTTRHHLDGVLIKDYPARAVTTRRYADKSERAFRRPWHLFVLPRERWALVYFDRQALLFVDRAKVPAPWLAAHEYHWLRPGDEEAFADAFARGELPGAAVAAEAARHELETAGPL